MTSPRFKLPKAKPTPKAASISSTTLSTRLHEDLEIACMDAMRGDPWGPQMATRLQRTCIDVLRAHRMPNVTVKAISNQSGTRVSIFLPGPKNQVSEVVLSLA